MGTADYLSPDEVRDPWNPTPAWDIYSLGCTLYRLLIGKPPYQADSFAKLFLMHLEAPILRVTGFDTPFPYTLEPEYLPDKDRVLDALEKVTTG